MRYEGNHDAHELLEAIGSPGRLFPRERLALGLGNEEKQGVRVLYEAAFRSLEYGDESFSIRCLEALSELCKEVECSELLGVLGGHVAILSLMSDGKMSRYRRVNIPRTVKKVAGDSESMSTEDCNEVNRIGPYSSSRAESPHMDSCEGCEEDEDEVQIAAANVASCIASSVCPFPMRAASFLTNSSSLGRYPLRYVFDVPTGGERSSGFDNEHRNICSDDEGCRAPGLADTAVNRKSSVEVLIRTVKQRQHSQFDVGFQMWPAAVILSRWMCSNQEILRARRVLEIGAGLGLCGLVAAHFAPSVTLSDFNPVVLRVLEANVGLNSNCVIPSGTSKSDGLEHATPTVVRRAGVSGTAEREDPVAIDTPGGISIRHLDWDMLDDGGFTSALEFCEVSKAWTESPWVLGTCPEKCKDSNNSLEGNQDFEELKCDARFDLIIASDHICQESDAKGTIRVLRALLAKGGEAHFVVAHPRTRFGVDALPPLLEKCPEFGFTCEEVTDPAMVSGLEEADFLAWLHVHVWCKGNGIGTGPEQALQHLCLSAGSASPVLISG